MGTLHSSDNEEVNWGDFMNEMKEYMMEDGIDSLDDDGYSRLHISCQDGCLSVVKWLVKECKADPHLPDRNGDTPLHLACLNDNLDVVQWLINECQADPNVSNNRGVTPLKVATGNVAKWFST